MIAVGAGLGHYTTEGGYLFPKAKVVRINTQPRGLWQGLRTADRHVQAYAKAAAETLVARKRTSAARGGAATRSPRRSRRPPKTRIPSPTRRLRARSTRARWSRSLTRRFPKTGTSSWQGGIASVCDDPPFAADRPGKYHIPIDFGAIGSACRRRSVSPRRGTTARSC